MNLKDFCNKTYNTEYEQSLKSLGAGKQKKKLETAAQKLAIRTAFVEATNRFPNDSPASIWNFIAEAHIARKSGLTASYDTVEKVIAAHQSWNKSSGHAFEEHVCERLNFCSEGTALEFLLQRDLSSKIKKNQIANTGPDVDWLQKCIKGSWFDLYAIVRNKDSSYVFGCIQSKTSIRDRVTRDREPSLNAMEHFFWSVAVVLNGDFLKMPKFQDMVNGGGMQDGNGWHTMFCISEIASQQRIVCVGPNFEKILEQAVKAANKWLKERQWLNRDWKA